MRILFLCPKLSTHKAQLGSDVSVMRMSSGPPRRRRTQIGAINTATVSFTVKNEHFDYLMAFWRLTRAEAFACRAITNQAEMRWYSCQWQGAPNISNFGAGVFSFSCNVIVGRVLKLEVVKYASHPYPILIDEDAYQPSVKPLDITLKQILKEGFASDAYTASVKPLDITLKSLLSSRFIDSDAYIPSVKPLDITLKQPVVIERINGDAYQPSVKPLNITLKRVLIEHIVKDKDAYMPSVKPLYITLKIGQ